MLELDLDLEADLGIDTVKQAELFAEVRSEYGIERDDNLELADFPTLKHIIRFVYDRRPDLSSDLSAKAISSAEAKPEQETQQTKPETTTGDDAVQATVLRMIAEQTGYPEEMIELDLDLEADLGIDTVKQAELFAEVRGEYGIERDDNLELADFPTLKHIIQFVYDRRPDLSSDLSTKAIASTEDLAKVDLSDKALKSDDDPAAKTAETSIDNIELTIGDLEAIKQIPRRVPVARLRPSLDYCKLSGVVLNEESRVIVMMDRGGVGKALLKLLKKRKVQVHVIDDVPTADELRKKVLSWYKKGSISGIYWLPALDVEESIASMSYDNWKQATHSRVKLLFSCIRELMLLGNEELFLISATRLGGKHGYDDAGAIAPLGGAVCGLSKAYKREYTDAHVKVVDFEQSRKTTAFAQLLIDETLSDNGIVEVGYHNGQRWTISLDEQLQLTGKEGLKLNDKSVFLVTGAAGSIVSAITADLAHASGGTFYLLDLTPEPNRQDQDIISFEQDKEGLKREIFNRLRESGEKATPVAVEKTLSAIERKHAAQAAIKAIEKAGGKAYYYSVNLLDNKEVTNIMHQIVKRHDKLDVLLHAGGLEISRLITDKPLSEFELVFDVKSDGWYNMLSGLGDFPIDATVVFSSIAGRFGNLGQLDYSAANDFLCKSSSNFKSSRPNTRGIALDWTAWGGIGMASRGSIPTVMKQAGIDMLPPEAGIPFIRHELTATESAKEVVVAQALGMMLSEFDEQGGLDLDKAAALVKKSNLLMVDDIIASNLYQGFRTSVVLDPKEQAFLYDHEINGTPVLPGVMGVEAMVEAASVLFPNMHLQSVRDVEFMSPFKFYRSEPRSVEVAVQYYMDGKNIMASCRLYGSRKLLGQEAAQRTLHFKSTVVLGPEALSMPSMGKQNFKPGKTTKAADNESIYKLYFHGPAYQVVEQAWKKGANIIGRFDRKIPANHNPEEMEIMANPRLIELCFQTAGIWEMGALNRMGLPAHIGDLIIYTTPVDSRKHMFAVVQENKGSYDARVMDNQGNVYLELTAYRTIEFNSAFEPGLLDPLKKAVKAK
jgi:acyl carrier protein/NAD(P)-dependent dehydrogenase (short-subunit alcohol dehydrogenase family)